jgi:hypothetical protein
MTTFYRIDEDESHLIDIEFDVALMWLRANGKRIDILDDTGKIDFRNRIILLQENLREETIIANPEVLYAEGILEALEYTDYPIQSKQHLLIISKRLLELLLTIKPFAYQATPMVIVDSAAPIDRYLPSGEVKPGIKTNTDYVWVKLLRNVPLDREKSIYHQKMREGKEFISRIKKLVLIEPEDGLDPIFRVKERPSALFITKEAREQLEQQGIQGILCKEVTYIM